MFSINHKGKTVYKHKYAEEYRISIIQGKRFINIEAVGNYEYSVKPMIEDDIFFVERFGLKQDRCYAIVMNDRIEFYQRGEYDKNIQNITFFFSQIAFLEP
jgi:hypothetical protein